jgi:tRNA(Arg) A34 adenosine deaminase TadA
MLTPKKQRNILIILFILTLVMFILFLFSGKWYIVKGGKPISEKQKTILIKLATTSIISGDLPISAIIVYKDSIIGTGYNTLNHDSDATGHAEINAIKSVFRKIGAKNFRNLNKDSLELICTYEPCLMCKGILCYYDIRNVYFLKSKDFNHWLTNEKKILLYDLNCRRTEKNNVHDSLFQIARTKRGLSKI